MREIKKKKILYYLANGDLENINLIAFFITNNAGVVYFSADKMFLTSTGLYPTGHCGLLVQPSQVGQARWINTTCRVSGDRRDKMG